MALGPGDTVKVKIDRYENGEAIARFGSRVVEIANTGSHPDNQPPGSAVAATVTDVTDGRIYAEMKGTISSSPNAEMPRQQRLVVEAANSEPSESVKEKREMGRPAYLSPKQRDEVAEKARERLEQAALEADQQKVREAIERAETFQELNAALDGVDMEETVRQELAERADVDVADVDERNLNHILENHRF